MNSLKTNSTKILLATALIAACTISQPVLADVTESATLPALNTLALESNDLNFAFEQTNQPLQMATLSQQEMKETEGAVFWWGVAGFVGGVVNAGIYYWDSPNPTLGGGAFAFGSGVGGTLVATLPGGGPAWLIGRGAIGSVMAGYPNPW